MYQGTYRGRNWYSTMYSKADWAWIVIYAYGRTVEEAFQSGFYRSDIQPNDEDRELYETSWGAAEACAAQLNEREALATTTTSPTGEG